MHVSLHGHTRLHAVIPRLLACLAILLAMVPFARPTAAASGDLRSNMWITDGTVNATAVSGTTLYIGGNFDYVGPMTGTATGVDATSGALVTGFPLVNGQVNAVASDGAGGWYIGGSFTNVGGVTRNRLAHILADKTLDPNWNPNANGTVFALAEVGTTVVVGGDFTNIAGQPRNRLAALDGTTGADSGWNPNVNGTVRAFTGFGTNLYIGGSFTSVGGQARNRLAAFNITANLALTAWDPNVTNNNVYALATNGTTVYAGGDFTSLNAPAVTRNRFAEIDATTGTVTALNPSVNQGIVYALEWSANTLYLGGSFTTFGPAPVVTRNRLAALDTTTGTITAWNPNANNPVNAIKVDNNTVYVGGDFTTFGTGATLQTRNRLAAIDATSGTPTAWNPNTRDTVRAIDVAGGTVFAGGDFISIGGQDRSNLAALDTTTGVATTWNPGANGIVNVLATNGTALYVGGAFTGFGTPVTTRNRLASFDLATGALNAWNPNIGGTVQALAINDTTLYAGGTFTTAGAPLQPRLRLAAFALADAALGAWNPGVSNGGVNALALNGSTLYVGGSFNNATVGGQSRNRLAAIDTATGAATAFNPAPNNNVDALVVSGNRLFAGGTFTGFGTPVTTRNRLAAFTIADNTLSDWNPNANGEVNALTVSGSNVYAGGSFTTIGGQARGRLAELDSLVGTVGAWNPIAPAAAVNALVVGGNTLYVGGAFQTIGTGLQAQPRRSVMGVEILVMLAITSGVPPTAVAGTPYSFSFTASGSPTPTWSVTAGTLPPGLTLAADGTLSGTPTQIGTVNFTVTASNGASPNVSQDVTFQVAQTGSTVTLTSSGTSTYGQNVTFTAQIAATGVTPTGTVTFQADGATIEGCANVALSGGQAVCTTSTLSAGNHAITAVYSGDAQVGGGTSSASSQTVNQAPLTITSNDAIRKVGQPDGEFTVRFSGFVNGEDVSALGGTLTITTTATNGSPVGTYSLVPSGLTSSNYAITFVNGTLTITDKDIPQIVWATPANVTYGTPLGAAQLNATATFNGQAVAGTFTYTSAAGTVLPVGTGQSLTVQFTPTDTNTYAAVTANSVITVTKAALTVTASNATKVAGQPNPAFSVTYTGFVNGENASALTGALVITTTATTASPASTYPIVPSGLTSSNYAITFVNGTLTVTAPVTTPTTTPTPEPGTSTSRVYLPLTTR